VIGSVLAWRDHVEDGAPIDERRHRRDQARVPQEVELAGRGRSAEAELRGDRRRSAGADRKEGDDPPSRWIREKLDPRAVSVWHDRPIMTSDPSPSVFPTGRSGR
jgi:hypothetical protein